jgi:hypothetical protein
VVRLANEIFLLVRRAYQRIGERQAPAPPAGEPQAAGTGNAAAVAARANDLSPPSQPKLDVDIALARRRRARSKPVMPAVGSAPPPTAADVMERARKRDEEQKDKLDAALIDLRKGRLPSARAALRALVAESPSERQYRAYLHYVTGRMHESAGRSNEAVVEYDRALGFDPELEMARRSREHLAGATEDRAGAGRFGRWFRK